MIVYCEQPLFTVSWCNTGVHVVLYYVPSSSLSFFCSSWVLSCSILLFSAENERESVVVVVDSGMPDSPWCPGGGGREGRREGGRKEREGREGGKGGRNRGRRGRRGGKEELTSKHRSIHTCYQVTVFTSIGNRSWVHVKFTGCHGWRGETVRGEGGWWDKGVQVEGRCVVTFVSLELLCACIPDEQ